MNSPESITYLRAGRVVRATGDVIDRGPNDMLKIQPAHPTWKPIWITQEEAKAGQSKPPLRPREKRHKDASKPPREKKPKPPPLPRWKELVDRVRLFEIDHTPKGWPAVTMEFLTELADELERAREELLSFLPMGGAA
jgi:hypothetical protein